MRQLDSFFKFAAGSRTGKEQNVNVFGTDVQDFKIDEKNYSSSSWLIILDNSRKRKLVIFKRKLVVVILFVL